MKREGNVQKQGGDGNPAFKIEVQFPFRLPNLHPHSLTRRQNALKEHSPHANFQPYIG